MRARKLDIFPLSDKKGKPESTIPLFLYGKEPPYEYNYSRRDVAQLGSALPWGGRGHGFESHRSDQTPNSLDCIEGFL